MGLAVHPGGRPLLVHGRRGVLISTLGVETGNLVQVLAATVGLAAIVASSAEAFSVIKYLGAAYLIFLGIRALTGHGDDADPAVTRARSPRRLYTDGVFATPSGRACRAQPTPSGGRSAQLAGGMP